MWRFFPWWPGILFILPNRWKPHSSSLGLFPDGYKFLYNVLNSGHLENKPPVIDIHFWFLREHLREWIFHSLLLVMKRLVSHIMWVMDFPFPCIVLFNCVVFYHQPIKFTPRTQRTIKPHFEFSFYFLVTFH